MVAMAHPTPTEADAAAARRYTDLMTSVLAALTRYRTTHNRDPRGIDVSDEDFNTLVDYTKVQPPWSDDPNDARAYDSANLPGPREGVLFGVPVRANSGVKVGTFDVGGEAHAVTPFEAGQGQQGGLPS